MAIKESNLAIVIAGEFVKKGFDQAGTAVNKLTRSTKRLAGTLGLAFGTAAILGYSKASVKAAAADIKAQKQLTLTLNNLGLARDSAGAEKFIQSLQKEFGIVDDLLRPAYAQLARATGNSAKSQQLLQLSLDVSAGTGKDLSTVVTALSKSFLGANTALGKLGVGISQADLRTKSFEDITAQLADTFRGQAKKSTEDFAGSMDKLAVTSANVKEIIGVGIIDSLKILGDDKGIDGVTSDMEALATSTAGVMTNMAFLIDQIGSIPVAGKALGKVGDFFGSLLGRFSIGRAADLLREMQGVSTKKKGFTKGGGGTFNVGPSLLIKAEKERLALIKKQLETEKKAAALAKAKLSLSKASATFDLAKISIAAALKATFDKETTLRLLAMQAIENDQGELALKYIGQLSALQKNADLAKLAGITTIGDAQLHALNTQLLKELDGINKSKMAQADKDRLIQEAFGKYNSAITVAGGLADAASYSEKTQISNNLVLKQASLVAGTNSALVANMLLESAQDASIKRVATAQALADAARMAALLAYKSVLDSLGTGGVGTGIALTNPIAQQSFEQGIGQGLSVADALSGARYAAQGAAAAGITVNISPGLITDPYGFAALVAEAVQSAQRTGLSLGTAGMITI